MIPPLICQETAVEALHSLKTGVISYDSAAVLALSGTLPTTSADSLILRLLEAIDSVSTTNAFALTYSNTRSTSQDVVPKWKQCIARIERTEPLDTLNYTKSYNYLGSTFNSIGQADSALACFIHVIDFLPPDMIDEELAIASNNAGAIFDARDDPEGALENYSKALDIFQQLLGEDHYYSAILGNNIGQSLFKLGRYQEQIQIQERSRDIYEEKLGRSHKLTGNIHLNLGIAYRAIGDHDNSISNLNASLAIREGLGDHGGVVSCYSEIASTMARFDSLYTPDDLLDYQAYAIQKGQQHLDSTNVAFKNLYNNYALELLDAGRIDPAIEYLHKAMAMRYRGVSVDDNESLPVVRGLSTPSLNDYKILENKAYALYRRFLLSGDISDLKLSQSIFQAGDTILVQLRNSLVGGLSRNRLIHHASDFYINAASTSIALYKTTSDLQYLNTGVEWIEKASNWNLTDRYIRTQRAQQLASTEAYRSLPSLDSLLRSSSVEIQQLKSHYPEYFEVVFGQSIADLEDLREYCHTTGTQWLYCLPMNLDRFATLLVTPDTILISQEYHSKDSLSILSAKFNSLIAQRSWDFTSSGNSIYQMTIGAFDHPVPSVPMTISGFGPAANIPWDALTTNSTSDPVEVADSFIGQQFVTSTMPSATFAMATRNTSAIYSSVFIAPDYASNILQYNRDEARIGADVLSGKLIEGMTTSKDFLQALLHYDLLHFAGHSVTHPQELDSIYLLLGDGSDTLTMPTLMVSRSNADLVVLGSCYSFDGKTGPEGREGLNFALSFAGTPNIISSLWGASDRESNILFEMYYEYLNEGASSIESLSLAKRDYLASAPTPGKHPYFWANWTYQGHPTVYRKSNNGVFQTTMIGLLAFAVFTVVYFMARVNSSASSANDDLPADRTSSNA